MLDTAECEVCPELANDYRKLLKDWNGRIMNDQFDIDVCHIAVKHPVCINDFHWRQEPSMPLGYTKYKSLNNEDKAKFLEKNPEFFRKGVVNDYLDSKAMIKNLNKRNITTLRYWLTLAISEEATLSVEKVLGTYLGRTY